MSQNDFTKFFDPEFAKSFTGFNGFGLDINSLMETQRKNYEAITKAQKRAMEGLQAAAQRQGEIISQMVEDNTAIAQQMMGDGTPEQKVVKQADLVKKIYEQSVSNVQEIGGLLSKSGQDVGDILNKRVSASLGEFKTTLEQSAKTGTKKAA